MSRTNKAPHKITQISEQSRTISWAIPMFFCVFAMGVASLLYCYAFSSYDDGVAAEAARLVMKGKVPYRDFWAMYGPASYYVNAAVFRVCGEQLTFIRLMLLPMAALQAGFLYGIGRRLISDKRAAAVAALAYLVLIPVGLQMTNPLTYWMTFTLAAVYCLVRWLEEPAIRWACACGVLIGLGTLFRQDGGVYSIIAVAPLVYLAARALGTRRIASVATVIIPYLIVVGSAVVWFACKGALKATLTDVLYFPIFIFPHARSYPYPMPWDTVKVIGMYDMPVSLGFFYHLYLFFLLPAVMTVGSLLSVRYLLAVKTDKTRITAAVICCLALVLLLMMRVRPIGSRIAVAVVLSWVTFAMLTTDPHKWIRNAAWWMLAAGLVAIVPFSAYTVYAHRTYGTQEVSGIYAGRGHAALLNATANEIRRLTTPSEKILSGSPIIYLLAQRDPATVYFEPHPAVTDAPKYEKIIIADMEREHVRYFVRTIEWIIDGGYFTIEAKNQPQMLIGYIEKNYVPIRSIGLFQIYERRTPFRDR